MLKKIHYTNGELAVIVAKACGILIHSVEYQRLLDDIDCMRTRKQERTERFTPEDLDDFIGFFKEMYGLDELD